MTASAVAAQDNSFDTRRQAVSAGLQAARIASAVRRARKGLKLSEVDSAIIREVVASLRNEIQILQNPTSAELEDESSFAFVGLTLSALPNFHAGAEDPDVIVEILGDLANKLEGMTFGNLPTEDVLESIEDAFIRAGHLVGTELGSPGEIVDGEIERIR